MPINVNPNPHENGSYEGDSGSQSNLTNPFDGQNAHIGTGSDIGSQLDSEEPQQSAPSQQAQQAAPKIASFSPDTAELSSIRSIPATQPATAATMVSVNPLTVLTPNEISGKLDENRRTAQATAAETQSQSRNNRSSDSSPNQLDTEETDSEAADTFARSIYMRPNSNRIYWPKARDMAENDPRFASYPYKHIPGETQEEFDTRVEQWQKSGLPRELRKKQIKTVFDELKSTGRSPRDIYDLLRQNSIENMDGLYRAESTSASESARENTQESVRQSLIDMAINEILPEISSDNPTYTTENGTIVDAITGEMVGPSADDNVEPMTPDDALSELDPNGEHTYTSIEENKKFFGTPLRIIGSEINRDTGKWVHSNKKVSGALNAVGRMYGLDSTNQHDFIIISDLIRLACGIGVDSNGRIFNKEWATLNFTERQIREAAWSIADAQKNYGVPIALSSAHQSIRWGGSFRYPVGCLPIHIAKALVENDNSCLHGMQAADLQDICKREWNERTRAKLSSDCINRVTSTEQYASLEHIIMAMCEKYNMDMEEYGVHPYHEQNVSEMIHASIGFEEFSDDPDARAVTQARSDRAIRNVASRKASLEERSDAIKTADRVFTNGAKIIRGAKIVGHVPLMATAEVEHAINYQETKFINNRIRSANNNGKSFEMTDEIRAMAESREAIEIYTALKALQDSVDGFDAVHAYCLSDHSIYPPTKEGVRKWCSDNQYHYQSKKDDSKRSLADRFDDMFNVLMPGDLGFGKIDSRSFIDCLLAEQCRRGGTPASEIQIQMATNPAMFYVDMLATRVGKDAMVSSRALYTGRISPLSEAVKAKMKRNGFTDITVATVFESWYVQFGVKAFELWVPFSNTIELYVAKKMVKRNPDGGIDILENSVGGSSEHPYRKAMLYDAVKLGQNTLQAFFLAALILTIGNLEPPDDPKKRLLPWEWTVKFPGMKKREPISVAWYMDDILQGSAVMAVCLIAPIDIEDRVKMYWNGISDIFGNNQVFEVASIMCDLVNCGIDIFRFSQDEMPESTQTTIDRLYERAIGRFDIPTGISKFVNACTPMVINDVYAWTWGDDAKRNPYKNTDGRNRTSPLEIAWNKYAVYNPFMAVIGNITSGLFGAANGQGTQGFSKFGRENSAIQTRGDKDLETFADDHSFDSYVSRYELDPESSDAKGTYAEYIMGVIEEYGGSEEAAKNGFAINIDDYKIVKEYLNDRMAGILTESNELNIRYANGEISYYDKKTQQDALFSEYNILKSQKNELIYDNLVYAGDTYIELEGTTKLNPETGEYYNYGDAKAKSIWAPAIGAQGKTPGDDWLKGHYGTEIGNDFQTNKYNETSDSSSSMRTSGARNLVVNKDSKMMQAVIDENAADNEKLDALYNEIMKQSKNGNGSSRSGSYGSGGSGGGYSYSPKIYSYSGGNISSRPATMYSKTPYSSQVSYLNPGFSTKGSRTAYNRQEL